jgi:hypothetical protein
MPKGNLQELRGPPDSGMVTGKQIPKVVTPAYGLHKADSRTEDNSGRAV